MTEDATVLELYDASIRAYNRFLAADRGDVRGVSLRDKRRLELAWREAHAVLRTSGGTPERVRELLRARVAGSKKRVSARGKL